MNLLHAKGNYAKLLEERRRALAIELARTFRSTPTPTISANSAHRLVLELGCGHGHFLTAYADAHPESVCVGVDMETDRIKRARKKLHRANLPNLHFIHAEARLFLETLAAAARPPDLERISKLFVLFPDPWPKSRHHKHRLIQSSFLDEILSCVAPDSRLYFRTDHAPYFEQTRKELSASNSWELVEEPWPFEHYTVFQNRALRYESLVARPRHRS